MKGYRAAFGPVVLLLVIGIGLYARFRFIRHGLWLDELTTAWVVRDNFLSIFERCWINNLSPLYYILVFLSKSLFGYSEISLRIPSVVAGILVIPIIYLISLKFTDSRSLAIFASLLASLDYSLISYSLEVRPYSLVQFLSLIQVLIFLKFLQERPSFCLGATMGILSGLIVLFHYTTVIMIAAQFIIAVIYFCRNHNFTNQHLVVSLMWIFLALFLLMPTLRHFLYLFENRNILGSFIERKSLEAMITIFPHFTRYILIPFLLAFLIEYSSKTRQHIAGHNNNYSFALFFLSTWYFIPILIVWFLGKIDLLNICISRYVAWIVPIPIIGSAILITAFRLRKARAVFIVSILVLTQLFTSPILIPLAKGDFDFFLGREQLNVFSWKEAVEKLNKSGITMPPKIYVRSSLVESQKLNELDGHDYQLLYDYLLSTVNSLYALKKPYMSNAIPIERGMDLTKLVGPFIFIGTVAEEQVPTYWKKSELSPKNANVRMFYVREESTQGTSQ